MSTTKPPVQRPAPGHSDRSPAERIARLRERVKEIGWDKNNDAQKTRGVLEGMLDLLADEL